MNHPPPSLHFLCIFFRHTNYLHVLFSLPLCLLPGSSILSILPPICSLFLLCTCPNPSQSVLSNFVSKMSHLCYPSENRNLFNSAANVYRPNNIAVLTTLLLLSPFTFAATLLSQIPPDTFHHPLRPACTHFLTSPTHSPLL